MTLARPACVLSADGIFKEAKSIGVNYELFDLWYLIWAFLHRLLGIKDH